MLISSNRPVGAAPARRIHERKACQKFATKLQQTNGNTAATHAVYERGVAFPSL